MVLRLKRLRHFLSLYVRVVDLQCHTGRGLLWKSYLFEHEQDPMHHKTVIHLLTRLVPRRRYCARVPACCRVDGLVQVCLRVCWSVNVRLATGMSGSPLRRRGIEASAHRTFSYGLCM